MASFWRAVAQSALAWKGPTSLLRSVTRWFTNIPAPEVAAIRERIQITEIVSIRGGA